MFTNLTIAALAVFALLAVWLALEVRKHLERPSRMPKLIGVRAYLALYIEGVKRAAKYPRMLPSMVLRPIDAMSFGAMPSMAGGAPTLKEVRQQVKDALERMETAHKALDEAGDDADVEALTRTFDEAETAHTAATERLERAKRMQEAREGAPVDPVEDDLDPEDDPENPEDDPEDRTRRRTRVRKEPLTYERSNGQSVFADLAKVKLDDDPAALERLASHRQEMEVEKRAHPNQAAGEGGEFIAPIWMQEEWIKLPRAGRTIADSLNRKPHPGTNQVNLPKIATGAATERQSEDGGAVKSQDATTTSVTGQTQTVAGQQDVSLQLVDLSNPGMDEVLFDDLVRDYNQKLDVLVITSTVTNAKGLLQVSGTNTVAYTDASPTVSELYPKFALAVAEVSEGVFIPPTVIAMTPRRWGWYTSAVDSNGRPLAPVGNAMNAAARLDRVAAEGVVGEIQGVPVIIDANMPKNEGGGTNQDSILVYNADNLYLFEDETPKLRVLKEVLSGNLQVRFQLYNYAMLIAGRLPKSISKIQGTGLVTPTF